MKRFVFLWTILFLSGIALCQERPDWAREFTRPVLAQKGQLVNGNSLPMPDNGLERHVMAIYDALADYCRSNCKVDRIAEMRETSINGEGHTKTHSYFSDSVAVDFSILHDWIDANGVEYVLLDISPGNYIFHIVEETHETEGIYYFNGNYHLSYNSTHLLFPANVQIKDDVIHYTIGVKQIKQASGGSLMAKAISQKHFEMALKTPL